MIVSHQIWCIKDQKYKTMKFEIDFDAAKIPVSAFYKASRNKGGLSQIGGGAIVVRLAGEEDAA